MTRLANVEKAGYFPLPPAVTDLILTHIAAPNGGRLLDPCAGAGTALVTLAQKLEVAPFGVELHSERAEAARAAVDKLIAQRQGDGSDPATQPTTRVINDSYLNLGSVDISAKPNQGADEV